MLPSACQSILRRRPIAGGAGRWLLLVVIGIASASAAAGQESVLTLEFNFSNPGARSMGFGGAFAALADDATAAFANSSGLVQLSKPEVSVEGRLWDLSTQYAEGGRIAGEPTGIGVDSTSGLRTGESSARLSALSFASFVYPGKRWSVAVFRHQPANFEFEAATNGFLRAVPEGGTERYPDQRSRVDLEIVNIGVAVGARVVEALSLGLGLSRFEGEFRSEASLYRAFSLYDPPPFRPEDIEITTVLGFDDSDWALSGGFLWRVSESWRLGGFYRPGPEFRIEGGVRSGPMGPAPEGTLLRSGSSPVAMPDVYGLGLAFRALGGRLTVALEWDRVEYSSIIESLDPVLAATAILDDGDEWHLGGEFVFLSSPLVAVRGGVWLDPDHRLRASEGDSPLVRAVLSPGDDQLHFAAGVGLAFRTFQIDLGVDLARLADTASISVIYGF